MSKENNKFDIEEIKVYFKSRNCELLSKEYINAKQVLEYRCLKHPEVIQKARLDNLKYGNKYNCDQCRVEINKQKLIEKYSDKIKNENIIVLDVFRKNNKNYVTLKCLKHSEEKTIDAGNLRTQIYNCRKCSAEVNAKKKRHSIEYVKELFDIKGLILHNAEDYEGNTSDLYYTCKIHKDLGIQKTNLANTRIAMPCLKCAYQLISGENHYLWKGGISPLHNYMRDKISCWKRDSLKEYDFKCAISGSTDNLVVHHVYNYSDILNEVLEKLNLKPKSKINEYATEELNAIESLLIEKHYSYGLGIPLTEDLHIRFHDIYGKKNNTYEQFEEFKEKYKVLT